MALAFSFHTCFFREQVCLVAQFLWEWRNSDWIRKQYLPQFTRKPEVACTTQWKEWKQLVKKTQVETIAKITLPLKLLSLLFRGLTLIWVPTSGWPLPASKGTPVLDESRTTPVLCPWWLLLTPVCTAWHSCYHNKPRVALRTASCCATWRPSKTEV